MAARPLVPLLALAALLACASGVGAQDPTERGEAAGVTSAADPASVASAAAAEAAVTARSRFFSEEDGWLDVSGFLDEAYGFLPIAIPITEPAVGYGAAGGLLFLSRSLGEARQGFGRPNISALAAFGTQNGTWGAAMGDVRYWLDDRLQTQAALLGASIHLDFYGVGRDRRLRDEPLSYDLRTAGGFGQARLRAGNTTFWLGLGYAFAAMEVEFDTRDRRRIEVPSFERTENLGALVPSLCWDTRDNMFTPTRGTYAELSVACFSQAFGGEREFQRARLLAMQFVPLHPSFTLGVRGDLAAAFGSAPFFLEPFVGLRGVPAVRYQGEGVASVEAELRWQVWGRFSLVGFVGYGAAWSDVLEPHDTQTVVSGGGGVRYEIARAYGLHVGFDVAWSEDTTAFYIQVGSAWARP